LNAIATLTNLDGEEYLGKLIDYALHLLIDCQELNSITKEKFEIMNLCDSELHDKTLIESALKQIQDSNLQTNMKKESKAYSYKEQLAEMELRKELEQSKGGNSKKKSEEVSYSLAEIRSKMSKKQQEQLDLQIAKEKAIRENMKKLESIVRKSTKILCKVIESNFEEAKVHFSLIFSTLTNYVRSPLCVSFVLQVFEQTAKILNEQNKNSSNYLYSFNFLKSIVVCFIRLSKVVFTFDSCWLQESLEASCNRLNKILKNQVEIGIKNDEIDISICSYFLPFFKVISFILSNYQY
jgi:hypothetical protein